MWIVLAIISIVSLVVFFRFRTSDASIGRATYLEKRRKFKEACLQYGVGLVVGRSNPEVCRAAILRLWQEHGPFEFDFNEEEWQSCFKEDREVRFRYYQEAVDAINAVIEETRADA